MVQCSLTPTEQDDTALRKAQSRYPERDLYLSLSSKYSPWYGTYFFHEVKVLVGGSDGSLPSRPGDSYGMTLARFENLERHK